MNELRYDLSRASDVGGRLEKWATTLPTDLQSLSVSTLFLAV